MKRKILAVILALLPLASGCGKKKDAAERLDTFPVKTAPAQVRDLEETIILVGSIKAKAEATLFSRVPGKLQENLLKEGEPVRKGQAVALVERDEVGVRFEPAPVPSTLDGTVARIYLDRGENVTLQTPVALVVDLSGIIVQAEVPERYAARAAAGQAVRVQVEAYPDRAFTGRVSKVSPVVDPATRSTFIEARLDNPAGKLRSGMFGEVTLVTGSRSGVLAVPKDALTDGSGPAVFVIEGGKARKREVELGLQGDRFLEVRRGLKPGEKVAVFGLYGLKDGSSVEVLGETTGEEQE
ncbi:MAG: efflux RND transporter periplasmic adaptor subunit [Elusimicrobia bacterium]|nr:efflux RND transporter periplasmic adaptor subunit [Elusimicrobiota bacterium]